MYVKEKQPRKTHLHIHKSQMIEHRGGSFFPHNYLITHTFTSCSQSKTVISLTSRLRPYQSPAICAPVLQEWSSTLSTDGAPKLSF